jgi:hypothetical protein
LRKALLGAALAAAILVPAASASRPHRVKLAVVVLPQSALGAAGKSLAVSPNSGVVSNLGAASNAIVSTANTFDKLGRVTGYDLIYGDRWSGGSGVTEISTGVDEYKTAADAKHGLAFWRKDDPKLTVLEPYGLAIAARALSSAKVGSRRFASGITIHVPHAAPIALVDLEFTDGRYVLHADVAAASLSAADGLAGKLARKLDHRLRLAEGGRLHGKPVKVPPAVKSGPPPGGPDLATLALTESDFGGQAGLLDEGYERPGTPAVSEYARDLEPAGTFGDLSQIIDWFPHANDATALGRFEGVAVAYLFGSGLFTGVSGQFTPVDVSAAGDNAYGAIVSMTQPDHSVVYIAIVSLSSGQVADAVLVASDSQIQPADVVNLAQLTANRLDAGLAG